MSIPYLPSIGWYRDFLAGNEPVCDRKSWNSSIISRYNVKFPEGILHSSLSTLHLNIVGGRHARHLPYEELLLSDHGKWRSEHWNALQTAYGRSPFWEYYQDDFSPFYHDHSWLLLKDFNEAIHQTILGLLDLPPQGAKLYLPEHPIELSADELNLSIIDLLCRKGNEAIYSLI